MLIYLSNFLFAIDSFHIYHNNECPIDDSHRVNGENIFDSLRQGWNILLGEGEGSGEYVIVISTCTSSGMLFLA